MERYALNPPDGERGFGDHSAVVADFDGDGAPEIAAWSWLDAAGDPLGLLIEMRLRVFSGADGTLLGLLSTVQELGVPDLTPEFDLTLAADANLDGAINASDIAAASTSLAADAALAPAVDCNTDGTLTMSDLAMVIERVIDEPQAQRAGIDSLALRNLGVAEPIAPLGSGVDPSQMGIGSLSQSEKDALESILRQLLGGPANKPMPFFGI
jgi:hypothetical protein